LSSRTFTIPAVQPEPPGIFDACPRVIDGKIYIYENSNRKREDSSAKRQIWGYDLGIINVEILFS